MSKKAPKMQNFRVRRSFIRLQIGPLFASKPNKFEPLKPWGTKWTSEAGCERVPTGSIGLVGGRGGAERFGGNVRIDSPFFLPPHCLGELSGVSTPGRGGT